MFVAFSAVFMRPKVTNRFLLVYRAIIELELPLRRGFTRQK